MLPLHAAVASLALTAVLLVAGLGASAVAGLALAAFLRRRSRPYLLVALAIAALVARTADRQPAHGRRLRLGRVGAVAPRCQPGTDGTDPS